MTGNSSADADVSEQLHLLPSDGALHGIQQQASSDQALCNDNGHSSQPAWLRWYLSWALPGLGMLSEAYIIFSSGQIVALQSALFPACFTTYEACDKTFVKHVSSYILICGIMAGMLIWGVLADVVGRQWGSRVVSCIMLSGAVLLAVTPWVTHPHAYLTLLVVAQTWYGLGVGGEYPLAAASAAERANSDGRLRAHRGRQVVLVFSNQGMGNLICSLVIFIGMAMMGLTGGDGTLSPGGARGVLFMTYALGALGCTAMVIYRLLYLHESKMFDKVRAAQQHQHLEGDKHIKGSSNNGFQPGGSSRTPMLTAWQRQRISLVYWWPRQLAASLAWITDDLVFYGNKLQQGMFISLLYPQATPLQRQGWTVLNSLVSLLGYYAAAWVIDWPVVGRVRLQGLGFIALFILFIIIYAQWDFMGAPGASLSGARTLQALYYLSSFFNQMGPNCTTWLVAGEIFPTDIRATYHGIAACCGKLGAIIASLWISYISDHRKVFLLCSLWGLAGALVTWLWLPDTTGLALEELDAMQACILAGRLRAYRGEAIHPRHLSTWERLILRWHKNYTPGGTHQQGSLPMSPLLATAAVETGVARAGDMESELQPLRHPQH